MASLSTGVTWTHYDASTMTQAEIYGHVLCDLAERDPTLVGMSADLAKSTKMGIFAEKHPDRFFNLGIAEQNLFGVAAGLAKSGLTPFVSTFATFASMRAAEQVRTDICYPRANIKIIATHAGTSFGSAGTTHHCTEDLAIMRSFANLTVIVPADGRETANALRAAHALPGPVYLRLGRGFEPVCYPDEEYGFEIGKAVTLREGTDLTLIACGVAVLPAREAAQALAESDGLSVRVLDMHTLKPLDEEAVLSALLETRRIITLEDHNVVGGLGTAVADVIARSGKACAFAKVGVPDCFVTSGYPEDLYSQHGLDTDGIVAKVRQVLKLDFETEEGWEDEV
jgi:transketolase